MHRDRRLLSEYFQQNEDGEELRLLRITRMGIDNVVRIQHPLDNISGDIVTYSISLLTMHPIRALKMILLQRRRRRKRTHPCRKCMDLKVMIGEGADGVESGSTGADALAVGVRNGEGDCRGGNAAEAHGTGELPMVELSLLGAGGGEDDGIPGRNPSRIPDGQPKVVPGIPDHRRQIRLLLLAPPPSTPHLPSAWHVVNRGVRVK